MCYVSVSCTILYVIYIVHDIINVYILIDQTDLKTEKKFARRLQYSAKIWKITE